MDYLTKPISRKRLRLFAKVFRGIFGLSKNSKIDVIALLDEMCLILTNVSYAIVDDNDLPENVPACCQCDEVGAFTIYIKNSVYMGAWQNNVGGYRNHIMHEMCHVFLYKIGYTPILSRAFKNNEIAAYRSAEWQAKALCGEIMMPFEATQNRSPEEIASKFGVSIESARMRKKY